jgi:hypothetical protein
MQVVELGNKAPQGARARRRQAIGSDLRPPLFGFMGAKPIRTRM